MTSQLCIYNYREYLENVKILITGAIVFGRNIAIDGFAETPVRIITHAHSDHLIGLNESIKYSKYIIATPITLDLAEVLNYVDKDLLPHYKLKKKPLEYHESFKINGDEITLLNADHIPGSSQVLVKLEEPKITLGYTGDFKLTSRTEVIENPDVLVIEATYGSPIYSRPFKESIPQILVDLVLEGLDKYKRVYIYAYHGKMQEVMSILRDAGVSNPFILPEKVYRAAKLLVEKYGFNYGVFYRENEFINNNNNTKYIVFKHFNLAKSRRLDGRGLHIVLTGRYTREPFTKVDDYTYVVSLSDHADYTDLLKYVELSNPQLVIVDGFRPGEAEPLKTALIEKGFCATVMP